MARRRNRNRPNATGRNPYTRFVRLDYSLLNSPAYRSLTSNARALLVELIMLHNGENNGSLYLALKDAAARIGVADPHTAGAAFDELQDRGFIAMTRDAHFRVKASEHSRARTWRLNHLPGPGRRAPNADFLACQPPAGTRANKRADAGCRALKAYRRAKDADRFPGVEIPHWGDDSLEAGATPMRNFHTGSTDIRGLADNTGMGNFHTYIANHGDGGTAQSGQSAPIASNGPIWPSAWWQPNCSEGTARLVHAVILAELFNAGIADRALAA